MRAYSIIRAVNVLGALAWLGVAAGCDAGSAGNKNNGGGAAASAAASATQTEKILKTLESDDSDARAVLIELAAEDVAAQNGLAGALTQSKRIHDDDDRNTFLGFATTYGAKADLDATLATLKANPDLLKIEEVGGAMATALTTSRSPQDALAWVQANLKDDVKDSANDAIATAWADKAPLDAAVWATGLKDPSSSALDQVVHVWGGKDLPTAVTWIKAHASDQQQESLMASAFDEWSKDKPVEATKLAVSELTPAAQKAVLPDIASAIGADPKSDPAAWYAALNPATQITEIRVALASAWITRNATETPAGKDPGAAPAGLNEHEVANAVAWLQKNTPESDFDNTWKQFVENWANADSDGLEKWLKNQVPGTAHDATVRAYAQHLAFEDADKAKAVAQQLPDAAARDDLLKKIDLIVSRIKEQMAHGGTPGFIMMGDDGLPLANVPSDLAIQIQGAGIKPPGAKPPGAAKTGAAPAPPTAPSP